MSRFTFWDISYYTSFGIKLSTRFDLIPYSDLNGDENKWVWLFERGVRDWDKYETEKNETLDDYVTELTDYDVDKLTRELKDNTITETKTETETKTDNVLLANTTSSRSMIDVAGFLRILTESNCPAGTMEGFYQLVLQRGTEVGYLQEWVKTDEIDENVKKLTITPLKKKKTEDEMKQIEKNKREKNEKNVIEMGLGDNTDGMGNLMAKLRESVEEEHKEYTVDIDELEARVRSTAVTGDLIEIVTQIQSKLARSNNQGVRLVHLRGQIFAIYQSLNGNPSNADTGAVFGVSGGIVSTSRDFASLLTSYPMFLHVTLPFTTIVRNMSRIRDWLENGNATPDQR
jgi:hypothetical protein